MGVPSFLGDVIQATLLLVTLAVLLLQRYRITLRIATPLLFATVGEVLTEKSGVLNLGIEGIMFFGAFTGFVVAFQAESAEMAGYLWYGILAAILAGMIMGWLMAFFSVSLGVNQHVAGLGITLLCTAISLFSFRMIFAGGSVLPSITPFSQLGPLANNLFIGPLFKQYLLTYLAFIILIPASWWRRWQFSIPGPARRIQPRHHRWAGLGEHCPCDLCEMGSHPCYDRCAPIWRGIRTTIASANSGDGPAF